MIGRQPGTDELNELRAAGMAWMGVSDGYVAAQGDLWRKADEKKALAFQAGEAAMVGQKMLHAAAMIEQYGMGWVPIGIA